MSLWGDRLAGAVVAIGNAPTALFHLLEWISDGGPRPAAIVGVPVGFVGSAESKQALIEHEAGFPTWWCGAAAAGRRWRRRRSMRLRRSGSEQMTMPTTDLPRRDGCTGWVSARATPS